MMKRRFSFPKRVSRQTLPWRANGAGRWCDRGAEASILRHRRGRARRPPSGLRAT
jgi:hypothetical protein